MDECSTLGCQHRAEINKPHCCNACRKKESHHTENCTGNAAIQELRRQARELRRQARSAASRDLRPGPASIDRADRGCFRDIQSSEGVMLDRMEDLRWYLSENNRTLIDGSAWQRLFQHMAAVEQPCHGIILRAIPVFKLSDTGVLRLDATMLDGRPLEYGKLFRMRDVDGTHWCVQAAILSRGHPGAAQFFLHALHAIELRRLSMDSLMPGADVTLSVDVCCEHGKHRSVAAICLLKRWLYPGARIQRWFW
jgi:hypothetical protein